MLLRVVLMVVATVFVLELVVLEVVEAATCRAVVFSTLCLLVVATLDVVMLLRVVLIVVTTFFVLELVVLEVVVTVCVVDVAVVTGVERMTTRLRIYSVVVAFQEGRTSG